MSELQLALIVTGAVFVAAVFAYNKWQEHKHRRLAERAFRQDHADVLLRDADPAGGTAERREPQLGRPQKEEGGAAAQPEAVSPATPAEPPPELADPLIDCVVRFEAAEPLAAAYLWQAQRQVMERLGKRLVWSGYNERAGSWERLTADADGTYRRLRAALQLADRRGPLSDSDLTVFLNGVQRLADEFLAVAELPSRNEVLARAAELDRFCAGLDIQVGVNVVSSGTPFAGTKLRGLAEAAGMTLGEDGMFHARDESGATLFTLANLEAASFRAEQMKQLATRGITFTLDVPRVADAAHAYERMIALAKQFATALGGALVDDNRAPLGENALGLIRDKVVEIGQRMAAQGFAAGGSRALRLFS